MSPKGEYDLFAVAADVARRLEETGVRYVISGSIASSLHGEPRSTLDIDLVADLHESQVPLFVAALLPTYYVDADAALEAVRSAGSFNAVHIASSIKVDFFVAGADAFEQRRLLTALEVLAPPPVRHVLRIDTAEHVLLRKLEWYRRGGEVSDRQWRDVIAIAAVHGARLDLGELQRWAPALGVEDLLSRCLREAGIPTQ